MQAQDILDFWFDPDHRSLWFAKSDEFDAKFRERFQAIHHLSISLQLDAQLSPDHRSFLYMPFMHSESKLMHEFALKLFQRLGNEINLSFEKKRKVIIDRFGRYPHRNAILGRSSSAEELEFLTQPNSSF